MPRGMQPSWNRAPAGPSGCHSCRRFRRVDTGGVPLALAAAFALGSLFAQQAPPRQMHLGLSAEGRPIDGYWIGPGGAPVVMLVGGMHGRPELNTSDLVWQLLSHFAGTGAAAGFRILFVPEANPDGIAE